MPNAFTRNQKTILSIDFARKNTCMQTCEYCYVDNMERIYPAYLGKVERNNAMATENPSKFAKQINEEYHKARRSNSKQLLPLNKLPIRIYGSGDYISQHFEFLKLLKFKFFIISKNLTRLDMISHIKPLLELNNLTSLLLSLDSVNKKNFENIKSHLGQDKVKLCFTGLPADFLVLEENIKAKVDPFFNIGKRRKADKELGQTIKVSCPADNGKIQLQEACTKCSRCWKSSATKPPNWNKLWQR